ncbi:MAG: cytochrome c oxidase assembly protein [Gemmatimonadales bacterium]|jgi:cytochrome c oxidase assembly factor CtaG
MTLQRLLLEGWDWKPSVVLGCLALLVAYGAATRFRPRGRAALFGIGVLLLLIDLVSPIDMLGHHYLFSVHMVQHLLLIFAVPPLLLLGLTARLMERVLAVPILARAERALGSPWVAWAPAIVILWLWHVPALYDAALESLPLHIIEHLTFLISFTIFWWPVLAVPGPLRQPPWVVIVYCFAASVACAALGILITLSPPGRYAAYTHPADPNGLLPLIREQWGLSAAADQQLGGVLMWVPGSFVFLTAIIGALIRWYGSPEPNLDTVQTES